VSEDEAAALSPSVIGHGADIVSQGSAPASSSRTAHSPTLSDSLRDSAADRPLASPPSVADAASEDEAALLCNRPWRRHRVAGLGSCRLITHGSLAVAVRLAARLGG